ncbi:MAG TPA: serine/threonine-protein kinase [Candidatus Acidoferrales bacterium]|nr:serine/threonine-protein kinase [Candidatus Acidoferrales bacterium]
MSQPTKTDTGIPSADETRPLDARKGTSHQDTVLLTTPMGTPSGRSTTPAPFTSPTLNTASLTALSQRYDILGEAGHGNMGNVYKARDRETGETVALKLIKPEIASDQDMMERFKNELLFARKITHKNVCRVYEFNRIGGLACTSMEYVEGESLRSVLNRFGGLPVRKAVDIALQICSGLKEAHAQGIVHRDLKPENVMIDAQGNVKIMDFGIARSMEAGTRLTGSMVGTPAYMAPEQVAGKPVDYRTDIYSLGLMLYEMFTGAQAFRADTAVAVALKQMRESPVPPHEVDPSVPVGIERLILKCLEKEPARRFQSIADLEHSLRSPSATGTGGGTNNITSTPVPARNSTTTSRVTHTTNTTSSAAAKPKSRRGTPLLWLLLGAFAVVATFGANRALTVKKAADRISPPTSSPAPKPPAFAFKVPAAPAKHAPAKPTLPPPPEVFPRVEFGRGKLPRQKAAGSSAKTGAQQSAQQFNQQQEAGQKANEPTYLLVGRFGREDRAQGVSKRLEDMNLPVIVLPRKTPQGEAFFVLTGPFNGGRLQNVKRQLEEQGFINVHPVRPGEANQNRRPNQNPRF